MDHEADIRFIDPHAEGDGRAHDPDFVAQKKFLMFAPVRRGKTGVIRPGGHAVLRQLLCESLGPVAALAINNAAVAPMLPQEIQDLRAGLGFGHHPVVQIGPVKARDKTSGFAQA